MEAEFNDLVRKGEKLGGAIVDKFDKDEGQHQIAVNRLGIAKHVIWIICGLLAFSMTMLIFMDIENKHEIFSVIVGSLFSTLTLIIGFVAGSGIDNKS